jgi:hypothetical protein
MQPKMLSKACPAPVPASIHDNGMRIERRIEAVGDESGSPPTPDVLRRRSEPTLRATSGIFEVVR